MSARIWSDGDFRTEVRRVRKVLKRLSTAQDRDRARLAVLEIVKEANNRLQEFVV